MSFVQHGGLGKVFPIIQPKSEASMWSVNTLRTRLQEEKVWVANVPGNVECWHKQILPHVEEGHFTFEEFVETFAMQITFDFGKVLETLLDQLPARAGGWYNSALAD